MSTSTATLAPGPPGATRPKGKQGFASMDREKARCIQVMGGKASHGGGRKRPPQNPAQATTGTEIGTITQLRCDGCGGLYEGFVPHPDDPKYCVDCRTDRRYNEHGSRDILHSGNSAAGCGRARQRPRLLPEDEELYD